MRGGDAVLKYMGQNQGIPDTDMTVAVRQIARKNRGTHENALLRGTLTTKDVRKDGNSYIATVHASFELIGLDDDTSNSFDGYFTAAASNYDKAVANADLIGRRVKRRKSMKIPGGLQDKAFGYFCMPAVLCVQPFSAGK